MPDAIITSTASTFGTISGTFAADQSTVTGTVTGIVAGTLSGSVGVPGPAGAGVPAGGTAGQYLQKIDGTNYNTDWVTLNLSGYAPLASPAFTGNPTAPTAALGDNDTSLATTAFVQQELLSGTANAKNLEVYVRNQTGSTLAAGAIVYINGATGNRPTVTLAQANNDANSAQTMGFVKTAIANNGFGYVIVRGECENLDTSAVAEGTQLYLSPTVAGAYTTTKPSAPQHLVYVGIVIRSHPTQGVILVAVQNGYELDELHDVSITSPTNGQVLKYNSTTGLWYNGTDSAGVAWGGITGTLSSQTDLQTALDGKYSTTNPAGYITSSALTGYATESWVTAGFYPLSGNPSGFLTSSALTPYAPLAGSTFTGKVNTVASTTTTAGLNIPHGVAPTSPVNGDIWTTTSGLFARINAGTQQFAPLGSNNTFSNASSTYGSSTATGTIGLASGATISGSTKTLNIGTGGVSGSTTLTTIGPVLGASTTSIGNTTATSTLNLATGATLTATTKAVNIGTSGVAGSTTNIAIGSTTGTSTTTLQGITNGVTQSAGDSSLKLATTAFVTTADNLKADLASPTFTGTPSLPTGTTAVTQAAGNNTTAVATTAFVTSAVPAFGVTADINSPVSTIKAASIDNVKEMMLNPGYQFLYLAVGVSGTALSGYYSNNGGRFKDYASSTTSGSYGYWTLDTNATSIGYAGYTRGDNLHVHNWNKRIWLQGRCLYGVWSTSAGIGDTNTFARVNLGGKNAFQSGDLVATLKGIGWKFAGGGSSPLVLTVTNGSARTDVTSSFTPVARQAFDWKLYSDGTGNVTLFVNDVQVATTSAGPTGTQAYGLYLEGCDATATAASFIAISTFGTKIYHGT